MKESARLLLCLLLVLTLCAVAVNGAESGPAADMETESVQAELLDAAAVTVEDEDAAFHEWLQSEGGTADLLDIWPHKAVSLSESKRLLNSVTLYPQKTGWVELDDKIESLLAASGATDAYGKLRYAYDWLSRYVAYSWYGYSYASASISAYKSFTRLNYLGSLHYTAGLQKSIPDDMANRAYHVLTARCGVCYDVAIAFAVIARYVGIDAYVHTGTYYFEFGGSGHHGWTVMNLGGANYIFDVQRELRCWQSFRSTSGYLGTNYYFGIAPGYAGSYVSGAADRQFYASLDASMLSVKAARTGVYTITPKAQGNGSVSGGGTFYVGDTVTLTARPGTGTVFGGWYDAQGKLLSTNTTYQFTALASGQITARFDKLYALTVMASRSGTAAGAGTYIPGTAVTLTATPKGGHEFIGWYDNWGNLLSKAAQFSYTTKAADVTVKAMFSGDLFVDLPAGSWYLQTVLDAVEKGYVSGRGGFEFAPDAHITRAEMVVLLAKLEGLTKNDLSKLRDSPFADMTGHWARDYVNWAYDTGIVAGRTATSFAPDAPMTREEAAAVFVRYLTFAGTPAPGGTPDFLDAADIDGWAEKSVGAAQQAGIMVGARRSGGYVCDPRSNITRAEAVGLLMRTEAYRDSYEPEEASNRK